MQLNEEQLLELEELGAAFTSVKDAAAILQIKHETLLQLMSQKGSPARDAYNRGRLRSEFETRQSIVTQAKAGSSPAQVLAMQLIKNLNMDHAG